MENSLETRQDQYVKFILKKKVLIMVKPLPLLQHQKVLEPYLQYTPHRGFKVYQMDVKCAFLNRILDEEVYTERPEGFVDPNKIDMV